MPSATVTLSKLGLDRDTVFSRAYRFSPRPLTREEVDSLLDAKAAQVADRQLWNAPEARIRGWAEATLYTPRFRPGVFGIVHGRDGSIWLRGVDDPMTTTWFVLDGEGTPLHRISFPAGVGVRLVDPPYVYGTYTGELDVPYVVRFRLDPSGG